MPADLITEQQSAYLGGGDALVLREERGVADSVWAIFMLIFAVSGFTFQLWAPYAAPWLGKANRDLMDLPPFMPPLMGFICLIILFFVGRDIILAARSTNWMMIAGSNALLLKARSFYRAPRNDRVVLRVPVHEVERVEPYFGRVKITKNKNGGYRKVQALVFHLQDAVTRDMAEAIRREHARKDPINMGVYSAISPLRISADGKRLTLRFARPNYDVPQIEQRMRTRYPVQPASDLFAESSEAGLTPTRLLQIQMLTDLGEKDQAANILQRAIGVTQKEAKQFLKNDIESTLSTFMLRPQ